MLTVLVEAAPIVDPTGTFALSMYWPTETPVLVPIEAVVFPFVVVSVLLVRCAQITTLNEPYIGIEAETPLVVNVPEVSWFA